MNKFVTIIAPLAALAASLVSGCATTPPSNIDSAKVAAIDRAARGRGVQVIWIAYPQRKEAVATATTPASAAPAGT